MDMTLWCYSYARAFFWIMSSSFCSELAFSFVGVALVVIVVVVVFVVCSWGRVLLSISLSFLFFVVFLSPSFADYSAPAETKKILVTLSRIWHLPFLSFFSWTHSSFAYFFFLIYFQIIILIINPKITPTPIFFSTWTQNSIVHCCFCS